jgi:hypothetical protein
MCRNVVNYVLMLVMVIFNIYDFKVMNTAVS